MRILSLALLLSAAATTPVLAQQAAPSAASLHLRMLSWPGKVTAPGQRRPQPPLAAARMSPQPQPAPAQTPPPPVQAQGQVQVQGRLAAVPPPAAQAPVLRFSSYRPVPHTRSHMLGDVTPQQEAQIDALRSRTQAEAETAKAKAAVLQAQAEAEQTAAKPAAALPTSIYAPAPAQPPARVASASPYDQKARFYSVHRQYGQAPDPVTLSPQFLAAPSPDLADPPPPPAPRLQPNATAGQQTAARVAARDGGAN